MLAALLLTNYLQSSTLYVSETGNDSNSGRTSGAAFRTLGRADAELKQAAGNGITSVVLNGEFGLPATLRLGAEANGVTFKSAPGTHAIIEGSQKLTGWKADNFNGHRVWSIAAPAGFFSTQLFVGHQSERAPRPQLPESGVYHFAGLLNGGEKANYRTPMDSVIYAGSDFKSSWKNLEDIDVTAYGFWAESHLPLKSVDDSSHVVTFQNPSIFKLTENHTTNGGPYIIQNVGEALNQPGQWYFDRGADKIYYMPQSGESANSFVAYAPKMPRLVWVQKAQNVKFDGIEFRHTEYRLRKGYPGDSQGSWSVPGAVLFEATQGSGLENCVVRNTGGYAVEFIGPDAENNFVKRTEMFDLGAGGVKVGAKSEKTTISDSVVRDGGKFFTSAEGIWIGDTGNNLVTHNLVENMPYSGINVGWVWGYGPSKGSHNIVEYNDIRNIGSGLLSDLAGIYTLGVSPGTIIRNNRVQDVQTSPNGIGAWGIYLDAGSSNILVENNLVENAASGSFLLDYGADNSIRNNIFAFAKSAGQIVRAKAEDHNSFSFDHNIVIWKGTNLLSGAWTDNKVQLANNIYWRTDGGSIEPLAKTRDPQAQLKDPQFVNASAGDFTLRPNSPARSMGFEPFDISTVGPKAYDFRYTHGPSK